MTVGKVGDVELFYEEAGSGPSLVLVHGSWGDHNNWAAVMPLLAKTFRVLAYDRRGHSQSPPAPGQGSIGQDVEDLAGLIELLDLGPVFVAGNSFGALITLRLASTHPDLLRGLAVHEPPGLGLLAGEVEHESMLQGFGERVAAVVTLLEQEQNAEAAELFIETIALGPGSWKELPIEQQATFVRNASTFLDEIREPEALDLDLQQLHTYTGPVLLTEGDQSPPMFAPILDRIQAVLPQSERQTYLGSGHVPQMTHPEEYAKALAGYIVKGPRFPGALFLYVAKWPEPGVTRKVQRASSLPSLPPLPSSSGWAALSASTTRVTGAEERTPGLKGQRDR